MLLKLKHFIFPYFCPHTPKRFYRQFVLFKKTVYYWATWCFLGLTFPAQSLKNFLYLR